MEAAIIYLPGILMVLVGAGALVWLRFHSVHGDNDDAATEKTLPVLPSDFAVARKSGRMHTAIPGTIMQGVENPRFVEVEAHAASLVMARVRAVKIPRPTVRKTNPSARSRRMPSSSSES
jgi:hypothetical protein